MGVRPFAGMLLQVWTPARGDGGATAPRIALTYGGLGAAGAILALAFGQEPLTTGAWLETDGWVAAGASLVLGLAMGALTILATRLLVSTMPWARALHRDLRPVVHGADDTTLIWMAVASGVGEELFFRGFLTPVAGVLLSSAAFGLLHQVRGRARWAWAAWAFVMGVLFALLYKLTGSLVGPVAAHVTINSANLRYLRDIDPEPRAQKLGGLLER